MVWMTNKAEYLAWWWLWHQWIQKLRHPFIWCSLPVVMHLLAGLRKVDIPPLVISVYEATVFFCILWWFREEIIPTVYLCLAGGSVFFWCMCGTKRHNQAEKEWFSYNLNACWYDLHICVDALVGSIGVCFSYQDSFLQTCYAQGWDHVEYPEEAEYV